MFSYMDSIGFYVFYLVLILVLTGLSITLYVSQRKEYDLSVIEKPIKILLIVSFTIFFLDSVPYLFTDIYQVPLTNIIFSNVILLLLCVSTIMLGFSFLDKEETK